MNTNIPFASNDDNTVVYFSQNFFPIGTMFFSLKFDSGDMINGGTLTPSVGVLMNHHLTYSSGLVYYCFETDTNLFVIAIFDTKTNSFTDEIYESIHEYKDSFIYGDR